MCKRTPIQGTPVSEILKDRFRLSGWFFLLKLMPRLPLGNCVPGFWTEQIWCLDLGQSNASQHYLWMVLKGTIKLLWQNYSLTWKPQKDWHIPSNYQTESCWSTLNIPLMYNQVLWNRFLIKNKNNNTYVKETNIFSKSNYCC